jgi:hypothetical protein
MYQGIPARTPLSADPAFLKLLKIRDPEPIQKIARGCDC